MRAAACTTLAFLASHPMDARGDECMTGPYRQRLLATGAFTALLRSALIAQAALTDAGEVVEEDGPIALQNPNQIVMQAAAVGLMHLCTMVSPHLHTRCIVCLLCASCVHYAVCPPCSACVTHLGSITIAQHTHVTP